MRTAMMAAALLLTARSFAIAQRADWSAAQSKVIALEHAWNEAALRGDAKALDQILDESLVFTDYEGNLMNKAALLVSMKEPAQSAIESISAQVFGDGAVVSGVYKQTGVDKGVPYRRRVRFIDTWVSRNGAWFCVAGQYTLIGK